jgi:hypothetical protein
MPAPPARDQFRSAFTDTLGVRRQRLESLAEIYATALEELRKRRDPAHARLIVHLETLRGAVTRELRYLDTAGEPPLTLGR